MPAYSVSLDSFFYEPSTFTIAGHHKVSLIGFGEHSCSDFDEILRRLLRLKTCDHSDDDLVFGYAPLPELCPSRSRLQELLNGNRVARQHPVPSARHPARLRLIGIRLRDEE